MKNNATATTREAVRPNRRRHSALRLPLLLLGAASLWLATHGQTPGVKNVVMPPTGAPRGAKPAHAASATTQTATAVAPRPGGEREPGDEFGPPGMETRGGGWHRRGMGGFDGPPPPGGGFGGGYGRGPMGGGFGGGPMGFMRQPVRRWQDADQRLRECQRKYEEIEKKRGQFLDQLANAKKSYQPGKFDPADVMKHQSMDKLLGELHQAVEEGRDNTQEAGELLLGALVSRNAWEAALRRGDTPAATPGAAAANESERRKAWLSGLDRIEKEGPEGFAKAILGDPFGVAVYQEIPDWIRSRIMNPPGERGGPNPMRRQLMDSIRQNWLGRIERMERQQMELSKELGRQQRELRQMRMILENVINDPEAPPPSPQGRPGAPDARPSAPPAH